MFVKEWFNLKNKETDKELFLKGLANADLEFFLEDEKIEVLSEQEKSLLESFRKLPPKKQKALIDLL